MRKPVRTDGRVLAILLCAGNLALGAWCDDGHIAAHWQSAQVKADWLDRDARYTEADGAPFSTKHISEVIGRARDLATRILTDGNAQTIGSLVCGLVSLEGRLSSSVDSTPENRKQTYLEACRIAREIAFQNPLLNFDKLLFVKRHDARGVFHMCDQFYGFNAVPGGGLYILESPFGKTPSLRNILAGITVENGRLKGQELTAGSFLSPELTYDGKTVYFAYSECRGKDLEWKPESCFHIFRVNIDGSGLSQVTDGPWDDFDPCLLPNDRIVFISERRGGYLRCGRHCPTYTMFSMNEDGTDIQPFSYHETHEWQPSVNNDGMVAYTRWDYVDRDTNIAHHIWTCFPDGRDPRSFHGNYPQKRESRPWMEMNVRAIPGSRKYVAVAAAHHGHEFGTLVLIDPQLEDDGAQSQVTRLTPDVPFPEAERDIRPIAECMVYGTPWPLSEDDYICVYGADAKNRGIYWIDRHGNRELLYRDPAISCLSPIPLRPRPVPPLLPDLGEDGPATVAIMNVYDSDFDWPRDTKITALRIIQVLPKTTPPPNEPRIGVAEQTNARAVLGTVPVEPDGSAFFQMLPGKLVYFQALDERGMAVQSMRSATYAQPGERVTCQGCHEPKHRAMPEKSSSPLALRRAPSLITPDVDGSNPFSYVRLVQPVLDRNCVSCHQEKAAIDLDGAPDAPNGWTRSYANLAKDYSFYYHVSNGSIKDGIHGGSRSIPGQTGARAAQLLPYLDERHYGVKLADEDYHRVTLWLDCNSEFYGAYENTAGQSRGEIVKPSLE